MSDDKIVKFTSKQQSSIDETIEGVKDFAKDNPVDSIIIIGMMGDTPFISHTLFNTAVEMLGKIEMAIHVLEDTKLKYLYGEE